MEILTLCQEACARLARDLGERLVAVALYGSHARGQAREDSDIDLFLVVRDLPRDPVERARLLRMPLMGLGPAPLSLNAVTPEDFSADIAPLDLDLALDAVILHGPTSFLARKLARLREILAEARLRRDPDLVWRWIDRPTRRDWAVTWEGARR